MAVPLQPELGENWPQFLSDYLTKEGISARVLNGGVAGYSSNPELLKLIRDVLPLKPDLIISLNGVNDLGFLHSTPEHPMVHPYQKRVLATVTRSSIPTFPMMPNAFSAATLFLYGKGTVGLNLGTKSELKDFEQWYKNVRTMHAISEEFQIPYLCFVQPVLGAYFGRGHLFISADRGQLKRFGAATSFGYPQPPVSGCGHSSRRMPLTAPWPCCALRQP